MTARKTTLTLPPMDDATWSRMGWHGRVALVKELARTALTLQADIDRLAGERADMEQALDALRHDIDATIDLRGRPANVRIIWAHENQWTPDELRRAHAAHNRGLRDEWTVAGHRIWDKQRNQRRPENPTGRCACGNPMARRSQKCRDCYCGVKSDVATNHDRSAAA